MHPNTKLGANEMSKQPLGFFDIPGKFLNTMVPTSCYYDYLGFRPPKKGEFYLGGAIVQGYMAPNDLTTPFHVVKPTFYAVLSTGFMKGDPVKL
jgi:hypothetical protein